MKGYFYIREDFVNMKNEETRKGYARPLAFITGASSGIGAEFARRLAAEGYDLFLAARREKLLMDLCAELEEKHGVKAEYATAELSCLDEVKALEERIRGMGNLEILVNNAGYARNAVFHEDEIDPQIDVLTVHDTVPLRLTHAALPVMLERRKGYIINVSSVAAFIINPESLTYSATKAFLLNASESLAVELAGTGVKVQALCPGFTRTDFHAKLGWPDDAPIYKKKFMTAEAVVDYSLKCRNRKKVVCIPGFKNRFLVFLIKLIPRRLFYRLIRNYKNKSEKLVRGGSK
jgi:short-subunit dehydrogenase